MERMTSSVEDWPSLEASSLRYLRRVLEYTGGNKTKAAEILGIHRRTIDRLLARGRDETPGGQGASPLGDGHANGHSNGHAHAALFEGDAAEGPSLHPARRALATLEEAIELTATAAQMLRAADPPPGVDHAPWRRALRRIAAGMVEVHAGARDLVKMLPGD